MLLFCFERCLRITILVALFIVFPVDHHNAWSWSFPFTSEKTKESAPSAANITTLPVKQPVATQYIPVSSPVPARSYQWLIAEDTLWNGVVQVDGMVTVAPQATLTIMPGAIVRFGSDAGLFVLGRIVAKGSAELPIIFTGKTPEPAPSDWYGIVLTGTVKKNIFEQLKIKGAETAIFARSSTIELRNLRIDNSTAAIKLMDSVAYVKESVISGCATGLSAVKSEVDLDSLTVEKGNIAVAVTGSSLTAVKLKSSASLQTAFIADKSQLKIEKSVFLNSLNGAKINECEGTVNNSRFSGNSETAVTLNGSLLKFYANIVTQNKIGIQVDDNLPSIWGNSIYANSSYNLLYRGDDKLFAGGNWFGAISSDNTHTSTYSKLDGALQIMPLLASDPLSDSLKGF